MEGANGSDLLNSLSDELLECVVAALIPAASPFTLASDIWAGALGLALSCRRMYRAATAEAHRKLQPPGAPKSHGVVLSKVRASLPLRTLLWCCCADAHASTTLQHNPAAPRFNMSRGIQPHASMPYTLSQPS